MKELEEDIKLLKRDKENLLTDKEDLMKKLKEAQNTQKERDVQSTLDQISYCNVYRKQVERFESFFGKRAETLILLRFLLQLRNLSVL